MAVSKEQLAEIKKAAETDLLTFIELVAPHRVLGDVHKELLRWWIKPNSKNNQLVLLPRDHQKSAMMAYRVAWEITRNPAVTILYISATENLAKKQLRAIKDIITSPIYRDFWPDMVKEEVGQREKWTETEICIDHPKRRIEGVRDSTVEAGGITKNITGLHCNICVLDDVVVPENAYTEEGRRKVADLYSFLASIESTDAKELVVGTRYFAKDLYDYLMSLQYPIFDDEGNIEDEIPVYEVFERVAENSAERDGSGEYLWPKQRRRDGKYFGFDQNELALKKSKYKDKAKFYAQYYNDPTDPTSERIERNKFVYYEKDKLVFSGNKWSFNGKSLNVYAGADFAWTVNKSSDYTAFVVIGMDPDGRVLILDIDRFKTDKISDMWNHMLALHSKWNIKKVSAETNMAQKLIVQQFKDYMILQGAALPIEAVYRTRHDGTKIERVTAILEPRYEVGSIVHYRGYNCQVLEEELVSTHPEHDDVSDALAAAIEIAKPPAGSINAHRERKVVYHPRFGGVAH